MNPIVLAFILISFLVFSSPDPLLMAYSGFAMILIIKLMWRKNEPKFLFFNMIIYWLTVSILLPYGALFHKELTSLSESANDTIELANILAVTAMITYLSGIHTVIKKVLIVNIDRFSDVLSKYDAKKIFIGYFIFSILSNTAGSVFLKFSGGQILLALIFFKWVFLSFMIFHTMLFPSNKKYVIAYMIVEVILSFSGFWSDYKDYLIVSIAAFFALSRSISFKSMISTLLVTSLLFIVSVMWSFSKGKYRMYLTGGERSQQVVKTNTLENIQTLYQIVSDDFAEKNFNQSFSRGSEGLLFRVSYIEYLGRALKQVPVMIPHENGKLLMGAFEHIFKPRILFEDKKVIDDSEITSKYTGTQFSGREEGASFAFGFVPERYVDFGPIYMFIPIFFLGLYVGFLYKYFIQKGYNLVWGVCYSAPFFNFMVAYGLPTTKVLGWSVTYFVGIYFINKYLIKHLDNWLLKVEFKRW